MGPNYEAAYEAFRLEYCPERDVLTFSMEAGIRAAIRAAYPTQDEDDDK